MSYPTSAEIIVPFHDNGRWVADASASGSAWVESASWLEAFVGANTASLYKMKILSSPEKHGTAFTKPPKTVAIVVLTVLAIMLIDWLSKSRVLQWVGEFIFTVIGKILSFLWDMLIESIHAGGEFLFSTPPGWIIIGCLVLWGAVSLAYNKLLVRWTLNDEVMERINAEREKGGVGKLERVELVDMVKDYRQSILTEILKACAKADDGVEYSETEEELTVGDKIYALRHLACSTRHDGVGEIYPKMSRTKAFGLNTVLTTKVPLSELLR